MRSRELTLHPWYVPYSNLALRLAGQNNRTGSGHKSEGDPDLRVPEQETWPCSLLYAALGELAEAVLEHVPVDWH